MKSPGAEWVLGIGYLATLDYLRSRGEADDDTLSEVVRSAVARSNHGPRALAVGLLVGGIAFHRHIVNPLKEK